MSCTLLSSLMRPEIFQAKNKCLSLPDWAYTDSSTHNDFITVCNCSGPDARSIKGVNKELLTRRLQTYDCASGLEWKLCSVAKRMDLEFSIEKLPKSPQRSRAEVAHKSNFVRIKVIL